MNNEIKEIFDTKLYFDLEEEDYIKIKDYITNLQQENDKLKNDLENEIADNKLRWQEYNFFKNKYIEERTKNAQAIEYIENPRHEMSVLTYQNLLNILQNGSEENGNN